MLPKKDIKNIRRELSKGDGHLPIIFNALSDSSRFRIFLLLKKYDDICVSDVARILNISLPAASFQLRIMEMAGLIKKERRGKMICYDLNKTKKFVKALVRFTEDYVDCHL